MKIKKLFAGLVATSMVAAMGTSAFAEVTTNNTYDKTNGTINVVTDLKSYAGKQMTVIIVPADTDGNAPTTITDDKILYINQDEAKSDSNIFQNMGVKGGSLADGTYYIKIGGEDISADGIIVEKLVVTTTSTGVVVKIGDTNDDGTVNASDISPIIQHILGSTLLTGKALFAANTNGDTTVNASDINPIINHILGSTELGTATYTSAE